MQISITGEEARRISSGDLERRLCKALRDEGVPEGWELSVLLTDDAHISRLHSQWMSIDGPTDVLSFPLDAPGEADVAPAGCLGDVVVSIDTAQRQADEHGHSLQTEVTLLAVHGALHLLGYDDLDEVSRTEMRRRERLYVPEASPAASTSEALP